MATNHPGQRIAAPLHEGFIESRSNGLWTSDLPGGRSG